MSLNIPAGHIAGIKYAGNAHHATHSTASASSAEAAEFSSRVKDFEKNALPNEAKTGKENVDKSTRDMAASSERRHSQPDDIAADATDAAAIAPAADLAVPTSSMPAPSAGDTDASVSATNGIDTIPAIAPTMPDTGTSAKRSDNAPTSIGEWKNAGNAANASPLRQLAGDAAIASNLPGLSIGASNSTGIAKTYAVFSNDIQALAKEFETHVNHFENSGQQWIGSASITFRSNVLNGASIFITGSEKALEIQIMQSALSPASASLNRQEKQLSIELARRLGRPVTLHISHVSGEQAVDNAEPQ